MAYIFRNIKFGKITMGPAQIGPRFTGITARNAKKFGMGSPDVITSTSKKGREIRQVVANLIMKSPEKIIKTAFVLFAYQWDLARIKNPNVADLRGNVGALSTLFNLGWKGSKPKANPRAGGSTLKIDGVKQFFGEHAIDFSNSKEMEYLLEEAKKCK